MSDRSRDFRNALGCFATGVAIVTVKGPLGPIGLTINSFASVSLDPPLVLWSLGRGSDRFQLFSQVSHFGVTILDDTGQKLSTRLSRKGSGDISTETVREGQGGVPVLAHAMAHFECRTETRHDAGDHVILIGRVLDFAHRSHGRPLVYYRGRYRGLAATEG